MTNANGDVVSYAYDLYGNKTSMTYPDGRTVRYTYDSMNRMTSVTGLDGEVTTYAYDAAGRRVEAASRNLTTEYRYDVVGSLVEQSTTGSSNLSFQYSYNLNGYITGEVRSENGTSVESRYTYDALDELISFTQSTGYGEQYVYDKVGNMTAKTIIGMDDQTTALKMKYNQGNQLVSMANGGDKITYKYDKNGSMVEKVLASKQYGTLTDTYAYNSLDQLVSYTGYDGYQQQFAYDANGMRLSKSEYGNSNRSTLEELLRGDIAGLPEVVVPVATSEDEAAVPAEYEWATTEYLYDITQEYYQVIQQTTTSGNTTATTAYAYGLERIAAYDNTTKTEYIYDVRGSVVQTISAPVAGASVSAVLPQVEVHSYSYTAFGEQMGVKVSGFGYNAEDFDAATDMINLRMRQYEPTLNRFSQKDIVRGNQVEPISLNRYVYCGNNSIAFVDANGQNKWFVSFGEGIKKVTVNVTALAMARNALNAPLDQQMSAARNAYEYMKKNEQFLSGDIKSSYDEVEGLIRKAEEEISNRSNDNKTDRYMEGFSLLLCVNIALGSSTPSQNGSYVVRPVSNIEDDVGLDGDHEVSLDFDGYVINVTGYSPKELEALQYALRYAYERNPDEKDYDLYGGNNSNCANYVHQVLEVLGVDFPSSGRSNSGAESLINHVQQNGGHRVEERELRQFDLVYTKKDGNQHIMIVVGFDENGKPLLAGNSNDRVALPLEQALDQVNAVEYIRPDY